MFKVLFGLMFIMIYSTQVFAGDRKHHRSRFWNRPYTYVYQNYVRPHPYFVNQYSNYNGYYNQSFYPQTGMRNCGNSNINQYNYQRPRVCVEYDRWNGSCRVFR